MKFFEKGMQLDFEQFMEAYSNALFEKRFDPRLCINTGSGTLKWELGPIHDNRYLTWENASADQAKPFVLNERLLKYAKI